MMTIKGLIEFLEDRCFLEKRNLDERENPCLEKKVFFTLKTGGGNLVSYPIDSAMDFSKDRGSLYLSSSKQKEKE